MTIQAVLLNDTSVDRHHGCASVVATINALCLANGIELCERSPAHHDWRGDPAMLAAIDTADCIIVNGEGTIHHDRRPGHALLAAGPHARTRGKKAFLINATWHANSPACLRMLEAFDIVTVRESASEAELNRYGFAPRRIPDLALFHRPVQAASRSGVAYCDSVDGCKALELYRKMWDLRAEFLPIAQPSLRPLEMLRWLKRYDPSITALIRPSHFRDALRATWQDYREQIADRDIFSARVAAKELVVTGRFHMAIFALAASTPLLAVGSNTHKIEATIHDAGLQPWRAMSNAADIDSALLKRAARWHDDEAINLKRFVETGRAAIDQLFFDIAGLLRGG